MAEKIEFKTLRSAAQSVEILLGGFTTTVPNAAAHVDFGSEDLHLARIMREHIYVIREVSFAEICLARLPAGAIIPANSDFSLFVDDWPIDEQHPVYFPEDADFVRSLNNNTGPTVDISTEAVLVGRYGIETWGHWLGELLPRAVLAEAAYPGRFAFLLPRQMRDELSGRYWPAILQSLAAYNIHEDRIIPLDLALNYRFSDLFGITPVWSDELIHPGVTDLMRSSLPLDLDAVSFPRLAVSRLPGFRRTLDNQAEIETLLDANGFASLAVGEMNFLQQVALFRGAEIIFAVLGSDLANLIYAREGVKVITVAPDAWGDRFFYALILDRKGQQTDLRGPATLLDESVDDHPPLTFYVDTQKIAHAIGLFTGREAALATGVSEAPNPQIDDRVFEVFRENLEGRVAWAARNGAQFLQVMVPDRAAIIPQALPPLEPPRLGELLLAWTDDLADHLLDPIVALADHKELALSPLDTYLRDYGAILLAAMIAERVTGDDQTEFFDELTGYIELRAMISGDLEPIAVPDDRLNCGAPGPCFSSEGIDAGDIDLRFNGRPIRKERLVVCGDSFGRQVAGMLHYWFQEVLFFRSDYCHLEIADLCRPDVLLFISSERVLEEAASDALRPNFVFSALRHAQSQPVSPDFLEALNAALSFPRAPYTGFIDRLRSLSGGYPFKLGSSAGRGTLKQFDSVALADWPEELGRVRALEQAEIAAMRRPTFVEDLSGEDFQTVIDREQVIHGSDLIHREDVLLFGQNHLVIPEGLWSCESNSEKRRLLDLARSSDYEAMFPGAKPIIDATQAEIILRTSHFQAGQVERIDIPVFLATPSEPAARSRWITNVLPKIAHFRNYGARRKFLCVAREPWQRQFLSAFGIDDGEILEHDPGRTYLCRDVMTVAYSDVDMTVSSDERLIFADFAVKHSKSPERNRRLFVSGIFVARCGQTRARA